jgi:hypothetical protein
VDPKLPGMDEEGYDENETHRWQREDRDMTAERNPKAGRQPGAKRVGNKRTKSTTPQQSAATGPGRWVFVQDVPAPSPLRGLLPTTPEIEELVIRSLDGRAAADSYKQLLRENFKMMYYFGGHPVVYRETDQGREVVAVGYEEMGRVLGKRMSPAQRRTLVIDHPDLWPYGERCDTPWKSSPL